MEMLKAQTEAINRAYAQGQQAGHVEGYRQGYNDAMDKAKRILNETFPRNPTPSQEKSHES